MPRPTVGRSLHYYAHPNDVADKAMFVDRRNGGVAFAATVAAVFDRDAIDEPAVCCRVSLSILDAAGVPHARQLVRFIDLPFGAALARYPGASFAAWPDRD